MINPAVSFVLVVLIGTLLGVLFLGFVGKIYYQLGLRFVLQNRSQKIWQINETIPFLIALVVWITAATSPDFRVGVVVVSFVSFIWSVTRPTLPREMSIQHAIFHGLSGLPLALVAVIGFHLGSRAAHNKGYESANFQMIGEKHNYIKELEENDQERHRLMGESEKRPPSPPPASRLQAMAVGEVGAPIQGSEMGEFGSDSRRKNIRKISKMPAMAPSSNPFEAGSGFAPNPVPLPEFNRAGSTHSGELVVEDVLPITERLDKPTSLMVKPASVGVKLQESVLGKIKQRMDKTLSPSIQRLLGLGILVALILVVGMKVYDYVHKPDEAIVVNSTPKVCPPDKKGPNCDQPASPDQGVDQDPEDTRSAISLEELVQIAAQAKERRIWMVLQRISEAKTQKTATKQMVKNWFANRKVWVRLAALDCAYALKIYPEDEWPKFVSQIKGNADTAQILRFLERVRAESPQRYIELRRILEI